MHPACQLCRGACCEGIKLPEHLTDNADINRWFSFHGIKEGVDIYLTCRCRHLQDGLCAIYPDRPNVCRVFPPGSDACLAAIRRNRPAQAKDIIKLLS